jgi:hypothetical protein
MTKQRQRYYRTAALLGPADEQVVARPSAARTRAAKPRASQKRVARTRKAMPAVRVPWKLMVLLLAVVGAALWVIVGDAWYLMWDDLTVTGLSYPQLEQRVKVTSDLLGYHRFELKPREAAEVLQASLPHVAEVEVRCGLIPTSCEIKIEERVPVLVWIEGTTTYWVDATGTAFPALLERPDLPVIRGVLPEPGSAYTLAAILQGVTTLADMGVPPEELECSRERGLVWTDPEGRRVAFGAGTDMAERWQVYQLMVDHFAATGTAVQELDVRFRNGITYTTGRSW